jgi:ArsR family transcriptional regulator, arsenate/arsenite/antimonite-responsive transcriptional repressor
MDTLARIFKSLSDETRLKMLSLLLKGDELCVCDLMETLQITQSKASRHLRYLLNAGLVKDRREAVWVYYRINEAPSLEQKQILDTLQAILPKGQTKALFASLKQWRIRKQSQNGCN